MVGLARVDQVRVIAGYTVILTLTRPTLYAARRLIGKLWRVVRLDAADVAAAFRLGPPAAGYYVV